MLNETVTGEELLGRSLIYLSGEELDSLAAYLSAPECRVPSRESMLASVQEELDLREDHPSWGPDAPGQLKFPFIEDD